MARFTGPLVAGGLLGAIVGGATMWMVLGDTAALSATAKSRTAEHGGPPANADDPYTNQPLPEAVTAERMPTPVTEPSSAPASVLEGAVALARHAPPASAKRGTKTIRGHVADRDSKVIAGAIVRATRQSDTIRAPGISHTGEAAPAPDTLETAVKVAVQSYYDREADRRDATTDANGQYLFADLREGRWALHAWCEGFDLAAIGDAQVRPDATVDFVAVPVVPLEFAVELPDGSTPDAALIQVKRAGEKNVRRSEAWSREHPRIALVVGDWELKATLGDPEQGPAWPDYLASDPLNVTVAADLAPQVLSFRLKGSPGIRGDVRFGGASPRRTAIVKILPIAAGAEPDLKLLAQSHPANNNWVRDGKYVFKELAPGRYVVGTSRGWRDRILSHAVVDVGDSMVVQDLEIPALDPATCVVAKVKDPKGRMMDDVTFTIEFKSEESSSSGGVEAERRADGSWLIPLDPVNDESSDLGTTWAPGTKVEITARSERFGERMVEITSSATRTVEIQFGESASLVATVSGYSGSGYEGRVRLSLVRRSEGEQHSYFGSDREGVGADGTQKFGPVEPGAYRLALTIQQRGGNPWESTQAAVVDVTLASGANHATIEIPTLYSLTIEVQSGAKGSVQLSSVHEDDEDGMYGWHRVAVDAQGRATFTDLMAGEYTVYFSSSSSSSSDDSDQLDQLGYGGDTSNSMRVRVPAPSGAVRFNPTPLNALVVQINKQDGKLAQAGFQGGDVVVAVDGKEFTTAAEMQAAISSLLTKKTIAFTVVRDGKSVELTVDGSALVNPFEMGGTFSPTSH